MHGPLCFASSEGRHRKCLGGALVFWIPVCAPCVATALAPSHAVHAVSAAGRCESMSRRLCAPTYQRHDV
jgi:hypothetical protein